MEINRDSYLQAFIKNYGVDFNDDEITSIKKSIWFNIRKSKNSLRLTEAGLDFVKKSGIRLYEVELPKQVTITAQILIWLDRYIESPYFIGDKKITVITEKAALELHMFSGDLRKLGLAKTLNKRINQI